VQTRLDELARRYTGFGWENMITLARQGWRPTLSGTGWHGVARAEVAELANLFDAEAVRRGLSVRAWRGLVTP
jgi:hypothetical protein